MELLSANGGRFEINQLLFADDTAIVVDSEEKLFRLVSRGGSTAMLMMLKRQGPTQTGPTQTGPNRGFCWMDDIF